jgi:protein-S-isoprenylcysteine O-methyltransferase Ste14
MQTRLLFMLLLVVGYAALNSAVTAWYRRSFRRDDNFLGERAPDAVQRFFGRAVPLVMLYYVVVILALILRSDLGGLISYIRGLDALGVQAAGFALGVLSLAMMALVRFNLGSAWRVGLDHSTQDALVTTGFYRHVRNPYFSFLLLLQGALCLIAPTALVFCALIQSALLLALQVRHEKAFLLQKYGNRYASYQRTAGRFLPSLALRRR